MPTFTSSRNDLVKTLGVAGANRLGTHFILSVAPPGKDLSGPDRYAFFFPDDNDTYIGRDVNVDLGDVSTLKPDDLVFFCIRDPSGNHQIDIGVRQKYISVAALMPADWVKIGFKSIDWVLKSTPVLAKSAGASTTPIGKSLPQTVTLSGIKQNCYDWTTETQQSLHIRRIAIAYAP